MKWIDVTTNNMNKFNTIVSEKHYSINVYKYILFVFIPILSPPAAHISPPKLFRNESSCQIINNLNNESEHNGIDIC